MGSHWTEWGASYWLYCRGITIIPNYSRPMINCFNRLNSPAEFLCPIFRLLFCELKHKTGIFRTRNNSVSQQCGVAEDWSVFRSLSRAPGPRCLPAWHHCLPDWPITKQQRRDRPMASERAAAARYWPMKRDRNEVFLRPRSQSSTSPFSL